jgi:dCTP diphosphatase
MIPSSDSIQVLSEEIARFVIDRDWNQFHDPKNLVMLLSSEVGELTAEFRWTPNADADAYSQGNARVRIEDEMADVTIALLMLAARIKIDLASAVRAKLDKNAVKYPIELSRGRAERPE